MVNTRPIKKIKIGFIGFGNIGKKRFKSIQVLKRFDTSISYIVDKKFKKKINNKKFNSLKKISKIKTDLIIISLPTNEVEKIPLYIFKNTKYLLIEKPISLNISFVKRLQKFCFKNKILLKTGYNLRFDDGLIKVKKLFNTNVLGKLYYIKINYSNGTSKTNSNKIGSLYDIGCHSINLLQWLLNTNSFSRYLKIIQKNESKKNKDDNGFVLMNFRRVAIQLQFGFCSWKNTFELELVGRLGYIKVNSLPKWNNQTVTFAKRKFPSGIPKMKVWNYTKDNSFINEMKFMLNTIKSNKFYKKINNEGYQTLNCLKKIS